MAKDRRYCMPKCPILYGLILPAILMPVMAAMAQFPPQG